MINLYSCGCHAEGDIPILSRCADHNGHIVAALDHARNREVYKAKCATIWHDSLPNNLQKIPDASFEHIFAYPEHDLFYAYQFLSPRAWREAKLDLFRHIKRILKPGGYATLIVDFGTLHTVLYQAEMIGLDYRIGKTLFKEFVPEPLYSRAYWFTDAKIMVDLFVQSKVKLPESGAKVLDISSILLDRSIRRAKDNKLLAFCSCPHRFKLIKETLK
jgi:SAM-dependent methyltransferase